MAYGASSILPFDLDHNVYVTCGPRRALRRAQQLREGCPGRHRLNSDVDRRGHYFPSPGSTTSAGTMGARRVPTAFGLSGLGSPEGLFFRRADRARRRHLAVEQRHGSRLHLPTVDSDLAAP